MNRPISLITCVLAILFAASGVVKVTTQPADTGRIIHGTLRIVFGSVIAIGALRILIRGRDADLQPPAPAPPHAATDASNPTAPHDV